MSVTLTPIILWPAPPPSLPLVLQCCVRTWLGRGLAETFLLTLLRELLNPVPCRRVSTATAALAGQRATTVIPNTHISFVIKLPHDHVPG